jgi:hypothetical protein
MSDLFDTLTKLYTGALADNARLELEGEEMRQVLIKPYEERDRLRTALITEIETELASRKKYGWRGA